MQDEALNTLFMYLDANAHLLAEVKQVAFIKARLHPSMRRFAGLQFECCQSYRTFVGPLEAFGHRVLPTFRSPDETLDLVLFLPQRQKDENLFFFADAMRALKPNGILLCAMDNEIGAARFEKSLATLAGNIETYSKNKCRAFMARKDARMDIKLQAEWLAAGQMARREKSGYFSAPGMFSWEEIDKGSQLLASALPEGMRGHGADFGAGYGYLACEILKKSGEVSRVDLIEGDFVALEAARLNVAAIGSKATVNFLWHDLTQGCPLRNLDWIVCNPPFHVTRKAEPDLGKSFIRSAFDSLKKGAPLYLVANQHLPYDGLIREVFSSQKITASGGGFKVIEALR
jgi:16S rRNA (guanine1207-N2)-methyltransferase